MPDISRNGVEISFSVDPDGDTYNRKDAREFAEDILRLCDEADEIAAQCEREGHTPLKDPDEHGHAYCTRCHALYRVPADRPPSDAPSGHDAAEAVRELAEVFGVHAADITPEDIERVGALLRQISTAAAEVAREG